MQEVQAHEMLFCIDFDKTITSQHTHNRIARSGKIEAEDQWNEVKDILPIGSAQSWKNAFEALHKAGHHIAIVSFNGYEHIIPRYLKEVIGLEESFIRDYVKVVSFMPEDQSNKREHIRRANENLGLPADRIVLIDDTKDNTNQAKEDGHKTIYAEFGKVDHIDAMMQLSKSVVNPNASDKNIPFPRNTARVVAGIELDLPVKDRLEKILKVADTLNDDVQKDRHNIKTVKFYSQENRRNVEVRYFSKNSYHRTKTEDFLERIHFLANVAKSASPKEAAKIEQVKQKYLAMAKKQLQLDIDPDTKMPRNFDAVIEKAGKLLSHYQHALIRTAYTGNESFGKKVKAFKTAAKQKVIDDGRPIIVHVFPDGSISAHFPKGDKTYPGDYRKDRTPGINPNSVLDVVAHRTKGGSVDIKSVGSRAASYSVFDMDKNNEERAQRHELNIENIKQDIIDRLQLENRPLKDGQIIEISSFSLLTPLKKIAEVVGAVIKPAYESETRQLRDHNDALMALDGREITVNGIKVKLSFNHMNFSVKNRKKFFEGSKTVVHNELLREINEGGFEKYVKNQIKSLDIDVEIDKNSPYNELIESAKNLQEKYFYRTCQLYYSGEYNESHDKTFHFVAQMIRAEQLRGVLISWNCKTSKDRSGWLSDYLKTYIDMENYQGSDFNFNQHLKENHEFGASLEATGKNAPGARGNRENDPTGQDKSKVDSRTSALSKINVSRIASKDNYDLRVGDSGPEQDPKRIYVYEPSNNRFEEVVGTALEETNFSKKHTIYDSETQVRYKAPTGVHEPESEVLWKVIEFAMDKFKVTDPRELKFEGALKEQAEAEIARRATMPQEKTKPNLEIKVPSHLENKRGNTQHNEPQR